jgi:hypothetical protein
MIKSFRITSIFIIQLLIFSCSSPSSNLDFDYGTQNDTARKYFLKGWEEILDNGRWTESEIAFRKAAELDPNWALGKSMVARITQSLLERKQLLKEIEVMKALVGADERLLLDVNIQSHIAVNNRDQGIANSPEFNQSRRKLAETNFGAFARRHPEDDYFKAEYIEFLHLNHGAQVALDSITLLANSRQKNLGFYISFPAALELELGNIEEAEALSAKLDRTLTDPSYLSPLVLKAQILMAHDSIEKAFRLINRVVDADPKHIIAVGMQSQLRQILSENH